MKLARKLAVERFCEKWFKSAEKKETPTHTRYQYGRNDYAIHWKKDNSITFRGSFFIQKNEYKNMINKLTYKDSFDDLPF